MLNEEKYNHLSAEAVSLANSLLSDEGDYLVNISRLNLLRIDLGENENDEDFKIFIAINSKTDHIPYGSARGKCSAEWLTQCDEELSEVKSYYRGHVEKSCKSIIERFGKNA